MGVTSEQPYRFESRLLHFLQEQLFSYHGCCQLLSDLEQNNFVYFILLKLITIHYLKLSENKRFLTIRKLSLGHNVVVFVIITVSVDD